jgi:hypothetical protein
MAAKDLLDDEVPVFEQARAKGLIALKKAPLSRLPLRNA